MKQDIWETKFSDNYSPSFFIRLVQRFEVNRKQVIRQLIPESGGSVIDLACGNGELLFSISGKYKKLLGLDIAKNRIKKAIDKHHQTDKVQFENVDLDKGIPAKNGSCDLVICEASLGYLYDTSFILKEINRVLKKGGYFIVEVPNYAYLTRRIALLLGNLPRTSAFSGYGDGGAIHYFTIKVLEKLLNESDFKVEIITNSGVFCKFRRLYPPLLAPNIIIKAIKQK